MDWNYEDFTAAFYKLTKIDLSCYKERQMKRRIDSFISRNEFQGYEDYYKALALDNKMVETFAKYITINVSEFFRNFNQWEILRNDILPVLLKNNDNLKIWSAACSTGEEPYSIAMMLYDLLPASRLRIIASDIDREVLQRAKEGIYLEKSLQSIPKAIIKRFFTNNNGLYAVKDNIKAMVEFKQHNLLLDPYPKDCHLIICRNVLIYFTEETKGQLYAKFRDALRDDGVLFVGSTEHIIFPQKFNLESIKTFFYKKILQKDQ